MISLELDYHSRSFCPLQRENRFWNRYISNDTGIPLVGNRERVKLSKAADETSTKLDLCLVTSMVDYAPSVDVNASFADAFGAFSGKAQE